MDLSGVGVEGNGVVRLISVDLARVLLEDDRLDYILGFLFEPLLPDVDLGTILLQALLSDLLEIGLTAEELGLSLLGLREMGQRTDFLEKGFIRGLVQGLFVLRLFFDAKLVVGDLAEVLDGCSLLDLDFPALDREVFCVLLHESLLCLESGELHEEVGLFVGLVDVRDFLFVLQEIEEELGQLDLLELGVHSLETEHMNVFRGFFHYFNLI